MQQTEHFFENNTVAVWKVSLLSPINAQNNRSNITLDMIRIWKQQGYQIQKGVLHLIQLFFIQQIHFFVFIWIIVNE